MNKCVIVLLWCLSIAAWAQDRPDESMPVADPQSASADPSADSAVQAVDTSVLSKLGSEYHNSIKLLRNRFRIDYKVDEVTLVFFRQYGSAPVVLVRPDGSKIFQSQADGEGVFWYDTATYDMINLKNPVPGPWQAVGQILPGSRVMVLSDLQLHADPMPDILFSGEILKQTAYLTNNGQPIDYTEFRDVVTLEMKFVSTNNPNFNNFGANEQIIATFEDNGRGMDEEPLDGVFTGQFNLAVPDGEWKPTFIVTTPMFTREQVDNPIRLYPNPIKIDVIQDGGGDGYHMLSIDADRELVDIETLLIDGKVRFPNGDVQNFSLTEQSSAAREHMIVNFEYGVYRIKLTAYGNTVDGRDFILDVPEYTFLAEAPELASDPLSDPTATNDTAGSAGLDDMAAIDPASQMDIPTEQVSEEPESMDTSTLVLLIVGINAGLIVVGGGLIWFLMRDKNKPKAQKAEPVEDDASRMQMDEQKKPGLMDKIKQMLPGKKKTKQDSEAGNAEEQPG